MREPVTITAAVVAFLTAVVNAAVLLELLTWTPEQVAGVDLVITTGAILGGAIVARAFVTPVHDPQDNEGNPMEVLPQPLED